MNVFKSGFAFQTVMSFPLRDESSTNEEMDRQCPTPKSDVTIIPVDFRRMEVKAVQIPVVQEPVFVGSPNPSLQERFMERFSGLRARIQSRRF